jgi:hypothetical protein
MHRGWLAEQSLKREIDDRRGEQREHL